MITGGAGGLGLEVAKWMAGQGARNLVVMSRTGLSDIAAADIEQLRNEGVNVLDLRGDVTLQADVERAIAQIRRECPPLKGVLHAAMVLDDDSITELNEDRFNRVLHPKMVGAWNLHTATLDLPLDHFICFSSISAMVGASRQSNYNSGNCFLDALAHHRSALAAPSLTINWGAILGAGFIERNKNTADYLNSVGFETLPVEDAVKALDELIQRSSPRVGVARVDWQQIRRLSPAVANLPTYSLVALEQTNNQSGISLQRRLSGATTAEQLVIVEHSLVGLIAGVFGIDFEKVNPTISLTDLGLDSLMAVELMNCVESEAGITIPMSSVLSGPSVQQLARIVLDRLTESTGTSVGTDERTSRSGRSLPPIANAKVPLAEFPLTVGQQATLAEPHNVACAVIMHGKVDTTKLREAFVSTLHRHPMLRIKISSADDEWTQRVQSMDDCDTVATDANGSDHQQLPARIADCINRPFNLEADRLTRLELFCCSDGSNALLLTCHPAVADSRSTSIAFRDLMEAYRDRCSGLSSGIVQKRFVEQASSLLLAAETAAPQRPKLVPSSSSGTTGEKEYTFQDFAEWQQTSFSDGTEEKATDYWINQLQGAPVDVDLSRDTARGEGVQTFQRCSHGFELPDDLALRLLAFAAEHDGSLRDALFAAFAMLVHRRSNQDDILIGYRFDGRSHDELDRVVGPFEHWLPVRSQLDMKATFLDFLTETNGRLTTGHDNQHISLTRLLERLDFQRDVNRESLIQTAFAMTRDVLDGDSGYAPLQLGCHGHPFDLGDVSFQTINRHGTCEPSRGRAPKCGCDLSLEIGETCGRVFGWWYYNGDLFTSETIEELNDVFHRLLEAVVKNAQQPVSECSLKWVPR